MPEIPRTRPPRSHRGRGTSGAKPKQPGPQPPTNDDGTVIAKVLLWDAENGRWRKDVIEIPPEPKPVAAEGGVRWQTKAGPLNVVKVMMAQELKNLLGIGMGGGHMGGGHRAGGGGGGHAAHAGRRHDDHAHRGHSELANGSRLGNGGGKEPVPAGKSVSKRSRRGHHQPGQLAGGCGTAAAAGKNGVAAGAPRSPQVRQAGPAGRQPPNPPVVKAH